jgi:hypothetical protein
VSATTFADFVAIPLSGDEGIVLADDTRTSNSLKHALTGIEYMTLHREARPFRFALTDRFENTDMFELHCPQALGRAQQTQLPSDVHARCNMRGERNLDRDVVVIARCLRYGFVKASILLDPHCAVLDTLLQVFERLLHALKILALPSFCGEGSRSSFMARSELETTLDIGERADLRELQDRHIGLALNVGTGTLSRDDYAILAQSLKSLSDHWSRDPKT